MMVRLAIIFKTVRTARVQSVITFGSAAHSINPLFLTRGAACMISISPLFAAAVENTCSVKAVVSKVHIAVWDEDSDQHRQGKIFEGWIGSGGSRKITRNTGLIVFSYQQADADRAYSDNHRNG
jgi:hypothetical protein